MIWGIETCTFSLEDGCVVAVSADDRFRMLLVGVSDHSKERMGFRETIYRPIGIELLVPTMFRIDLSEHK